MDAAVGQSLKEESMCDMDVKVTRRSFVGGIAAAAAVPNMAAASSAKDKPFVWAQLVHLSSNMWGNDGLSPETVEDGEEVISKTLRCDDAVWKRVVDAVASSGANTLVIDIGDGLSYPSHPELAIEGSWSAEKLAAEVARIRSLGLEVVPKLNFSTTHDQWLKVYNRMVGTYKYYEVCRDVIADVCDVFGKVKLFHIGMNDEGMVQKRAFKGYGTFRNKGFWFEDVKFYAKELEKRGIRAWMWADLADEWAEEYVKRCPKSILQTVGYDYDPFDEAGRKALGPVWSAFWNARLKSFGKLDAAGFEVVAASTKRNADSTNVFAQVMKYAKSRKLKHLAGGLQTSWSFMLEGDAGENANIKSIEQLKETVKLWRA